MALHDDVEVRRGKDAVSWEDASEASPAWIAYVNLRVRDREDHG